MPSYGHVDRFVYNEQMTFDPLPPGWQDLPARDRLLHTAHALFYRDGIRATGIDRVIAESGVTKVTFYRHFPSKNDLICAYLEYRHTGWMAWFGDALQRHAHALPAGTDRTRALAPALAEWLGSEHFRGCAFINSVSELGDTCLLYTSPSPRDQRGSRMPSSA